jgi:hypothetical protein
MGSIVQFGDVPAWIGTAAGVGSLYLGLRTVSRRRHSTSHRPSKSWPA